MDGDAVGCFGVEVGAAEGNAVGAVGDIVAEHKAAVPLCAQNCVHSFLTLVKSNGTKLIQSMPKAHFFVCNRSLS